MINKKTGGIHCNCDPARFFNLQSGRIRFDQGILFILNIFSGPDFLKSGAICGLLFPGFV